MLIAQAWLRNRHHRLLILFDIGLQCLQRRAIGCSLLLPSFPIPPELFLNLSLCSFAVFRLTLCHHFFQFGQGKHLCLFRADAMAVLSLILVATVTIVLAVSKILEHRQARAVRLGERLPGPKGK